MYCMRSVMLKVAFLALVVFAAIDVSFAGTYSGGDGTEPNPYLISSVDDLLELRDTPTDYSAYFRQTCDLDLSSLPFYGAVIARDIDQSTSGYQGTPFTGIYDGMGFTISSFSVNTVFGNATFVGLFGYNQGEIVNLTVDGKIDLSQGDHVGLLCGYNISVIANCHSVGTVDCGDNSTQVGGLIGESYNGSISHCSSNTTITCGSNCGNIGGFIGWDGMQNVTRTIEYCCSFGDVTVGDDCSGIGGFCGYAKAYNLEGSPQTLYIINCYSTGDIYCASSATSIGGFCGELCAGGYWNWDYSHSRIDKCYYVGNVTVGDSSSNVGGLNGRRYAYRIHSTATVTNSFWNTDTCRVGSSDGGIGLDDAQMKDINVYLMYGWDFCGFIVNGTEDIWVMPGVPVDCQIPDPTYEYPQFIWQEPSNEVELVSISVSGPDSVLEYSKTNFTCTASYSDGSTEDVSGQTSWSVSDPNWATIDNSGLLTSLEVYSPQSITITTQYEDLQDSKEITIEPVIPDVTGLFLWEADSVLSENGLEIGDITVTRSGGTENCSVVSQNPVGGTPVQNTERVDLVIYLGD